MAQHWHTSALWIGFILLFSIQFSCSPSSQGPEESAAIRLATPVSITFTDDLDRDSLRTALQRSLNYVKRLPPQRLLPFLGQHITAAIQRDTLETFLAILDQAPTPEAFNTAVHEQFDIVQAAGRKGRGDVLVTSYYEAYLDGSLQPTEEFTYPLYTRPSDLIEIDLARFRSDWSGERLTARLEKGQVLPYFTRREIDFENKLNGRALELVWLRDRVDGFFLHIQGSGTIHLSDGQLMRVNYAASNGYTYRSIGQFLIRQGRLSAEQVTMQRLEHYLRTHDAEQADILSHNPRYIFFRQVREGPVGSLNLILVPGRSIATDPRLFPATGLAFIQTQQPILNATNQVVGWKPLSRFVFNHDTGNAIKGPGRVDLFWGSGDTAEAAAGRIKHQGTLRFLVKRAAQSEKR
ncbi:transglycosylase [Candidatus Entotheonella serta]|nr:transglycosylase [Candidatus Entotheonella serta]